MEKEDLKNWYDSNGYSALGNFLLVKGGFQAEFSSQDLRTIGELLPQGHRFYLELSEASVLEDSTWTIYSTEDTNLALGHIPYLPGRLVAEQSKHQQDGRFTMLHWTYEEYYWHLIQHCEAKPEIGARVYQKHWDKTDPSSIKNGSLEQMRNWVKEQERNCKDPLGVHYPRHVLKYWPFDPDKKGVLYSKQRDGSLREESKGEPAFLRVVAAVGTGTMFGDNDLKAFRDPARPFTLPASERSKVGLKTIRHGLDRGVSLI